MRGIKMTREELKEHCEKTVEQCEMWAIHRGEKPSGKVYEEHKAVLDILEQEPTSEMVHVETLRQVMWERDIAIDQLHELGYELGQKIESCDDVISRSAALKFTCDDCKHSDSCVNAQNGYKYPNCAYSLRQLPSVTQKCEKCAMNGSGSKYCDNCGQKSGKWIKKEYWKPLPYDTEPLDYDNYDEKTHSEKVYHYYCSECDRDEGETKPTDNYCPNCGAKMESEVRYGSD